MPSRQSACCVTQVYPKTGPVFQAAFERTNTEHTFTSRTVARRSKYLLLRPKPSVHDSQTEKLTFFYAVNRLTINFNFYYIDSNLTD